MSKLAATLVACLAVLATLSPTAFANSQAGYKIQTTASDFETALFGLENAIVNRGLVIDSQGHVGKMLERTSKATGGESPYLGARYLNFCSAKLSQTAMQADPDNLAVCPYTMFVYELKSEPGKARIGYRRPHTSEDPASKKALAAIDALLSALMKEAVQ